MYESLYGLAEFEPVRVAELYESELVKMMDTVQQVEYLLRVARVYEEEMADATKAIGTFRRVLEVEQDNMQAILALDRLYERGQHWAELSDVLRREIRLANSDAEIVALQFRLGQLYEQSLRDVDNAIEVYREILTSNPTHAPTLEALEQLFLDGLMGLLTVKLVYHRQPVTPEFVERLLDHIILMVAPPKPVAHEPRPEPAPPATVRPARGRAKKKPKPATRSRVAR
mgnify:CR=1 FL=1